MFVHIVVWRVHPETPVAARLACKTELENLNGKIPGLIKISVGIDTLRGPNSGDIALYSKFESKAAFEQYQTHPLHEIAKGFFTGIVAERRIVDYDVTD
jgi:Stress responsive A/B Barrel Domain